MYPMAVCTVRYARKKAALLVAQEWKPFWSEPWKRSGYFSESVAMGEPWVRKWRRIPTTGRTIEGSRVIYDDPRM